MFRRGLVNSSLYLTIYYFWKGGIMNEYEQKQEARRERYQNLSDKADNDSTAYYNRSHDEAQLVPLGQPILVGHHSEGRMRAHYNRVGRLMDKSCESAKKSEYYQQKAASVGSGGISSDDPEAIQKLKHKIERAEDCQANMKAANKIIKSKKMTLDEKTAKLVEMGYTETKAITLHHPDFCGRIGFASYMLTNNNANIRRMKQRLESLQAVEGKENKTIPFDGGEIVHNYEENRIQIFHDEKPEKPTCKFLRSLGFVFSRFNVCWQRKISNAGFYAADRFVESLNN